MGTFQDSHLPNAMNLVSQHGSSTKPKQEDRTNDPDVVETSTVATATYIALVDENSHANPAGLQNSQAKHHGVTTRTRADGDISAHVDDGPQLAHARPPDAACLPDLTPQLLQPP